MRIKELGLTFLFLLGMYSGAIAQIDNSDFKIELDANDLGVCGDNSTELVTVTAKKSTLADSEIIIDFPQGVEYVLNSATLISQPGGYTFSVIDDSDTDRPLFGITSTGNWGIGDEVTFEIERSAACDAVIFKNDLGGIFKDAQEITYTDAGTPDSASDLSLTIYTYNLLDPSVSIQSVPTLSASVGDIVTRNIDVEQGGQGCLETFSYYVTTSTDLGSYQLSYDGTILTPTSVVSTPTGDTLFYTVDLAVSPYLGTVGNGDLCWENGETIAFTEQFEILDCNDLETRHHAFWGCDIDVCQIAAPQSGGITIDAGVPDIVISEPVPVTIDLCDTITYTVRITNNGGSDVVPAYDLNFFFGMGANASPISTVLNQTLWGDGRFNTRNWDNFELNGNPVVLSEFPTTLYNATWGGPSWFGYDVYTSDPDGAGVGLDDLDGDGFFDDLAPGAFVDVTFEFWTDPLDNCGTGRYDYLGWEHHYFDVSSFDQCGDIVPDQKRIDFDYRNFIRDYQIASDFDVPSDVDDGVDFNLMVRPYLYSNSVQCHGQNSLTGSFATWDVRLFLPTGVSLSASDGIDSHFSSFSPSKTVIPGVGGDTVVYALNRYDYDEYNFLLNMDCATYLGAGGSSTLTIPYETNYYCSDGTDVCWEQKIHCGSLSMTTHCIGACKGPSTISFDGTRTTAGYTDATLTTQVTLDPAIHDLDQYNAGDTMLLTSKAVIVDSAITSLLFDIDYTATANQGGIGIIEFVEGQITIDDVSVGSFTGDISMAPVLSSTGTDHTQTFDLSSYTSLVSGSYEYGEGNERDTVEVELKFVFSKNFSSAVAYELGGFRGTHYAIDPATMSQVACDSYGDRAYYHQVRTSAGANAEVTFACQPVLLDAFFSRISAVNDVHPNEFRPPVVWDSTLVIIPPASTFTGKVDIYDLPLGWQYNTTSFTQSGDSIWVYRPPGHGLADQRTTYYPRVRVEIQGTCDAPVTQTWSSKNYLTNYIYHPNVDVWENIELSGPTRNFTFTQPTFLVQSPNPTENGFATSISWEVELCNNSSTDIDFNWFRIQPTSGIVLDSIVDPTTGSLPLTVVGGERFVELGILGEAPDCNSYTVYASYTSCDPLSVTLEHGWDCAGYPSDYSEVSEGCYVEEITLTVEPQEAQIQLSITEEPTAPIPLCDQFEMSIEFISAQISDANDPYLTFTLPSSGAAILIDSVTVEYPRGSGDIQSVPYVLSGLTQTADLMGHSAIFANGGILGTEAAASTEERIADVTLYLQLGCDFPSGTSIDFAPYATSPCGDLAIGSGGVTTSDAIFVNGAVAPYDAFTSITLPDSMSYCGTSTIDFSTTIVNGSTGTTDSILIDLPVGLRFISGSLTCSGPNCPTGTPIVSDDFGFDQVLIDYPSGVPSGGVIEFTIGVEHSEAVCSELATVSILNFSSNSGLACATSTCAATPVPTGTSAESVILAKPDIVLQSYSSSSAALPSGGVRYFIDLSVENVGIDALDVYDYAIYCSDGSADIDGAAIYTGTLTSILNSSDTESASFSFDVSSACANTDLIFSIVPGSSDCLCATQLFELTVNALAPLPDTDGDGVVDMDDLDDDNDGIPDLIEVPFDPLTDADGDGVPAYLDDNDADDSIGNADGMVETVFDTDGDNVPDHFDLDSDNDGIYDIVESGHGENDADVNGRIDGSPSDFGGNGLFDGVETTADSGNLNYTVSDSDGDGNIDSIELDSDNDGCRDVIEAGYVDADGNGLLGQGS